MSHDETIYARGMTWSLGANLLGMIAALGATVVAARLLEKADLGVFFLILAITQVGAVLGDFGVRNTTIRVLSTLDTQERDRAAQYFVSTNLLASLGSAAIVAIALPWLQTVWPYPAFLRCAWLAVPAATLIINFQLATSLLVSARKFGALAFVNAGSEVLRTILSVSCLVAGWGIAGLLWSLIISRAVGILVVASVVPAQFRFRLSHVRRSEFARTGGWLYASSVASVATSRIADAMLASLMGPASLAIYAAAMQLPGTLQRAFESIRPVLLGYTSSVGVSKSRLVTEARLLSGVLAVGTLVLLVISESMVLMLFSDEYRDAVDVMRVLCVWVSIGVANYYLAIVMIGAGRVREMFCVALPQLAAMLAITALLVPVLAGVGAAIALVAASTVGCLLACYVLADANWQLMGSLLMTLLRAFIPPCVVCWIAIVVDDRPLTLLVLVGGAAITLFVTRALTAADVHGFGMTLARRCRATPTVSAPRK